jgi:adenylosuccinate lyase
MVGRTHGQPGAPITFGFKAASWADEVRRHLDRLREGRPRWLVAQLGGAVGVLRFVGDEGPAVRAAFCAELGLSDPGISWLTARDRLAEFANVLAMICGTLARIGNEVLELQRPEIGELREPTNHDAVGSITMPHKRNPERSEHLDTLARLVRADAGVLVEGLAQLHERDGRGWKAEWVAFPEVCLLSGVALQTAKQLLQGLEVDVEAMAANLRTQVGSERVLAALSARLGKHEAQARMHEALRPGAERPAALEDAGLLDAEELRDLLATPAVQGAKAMVDEVVARSRAARLVEDDQWA